MEMEELSMKMIIKLGENDVKSLEDFAYCSTDDLIGWDEYIDGEKTHESGILESFDLSEDYANELIMKARKLIGIIEEDNIEVENKNIDKFNGFLAGLITNVTNIKVLKVGKVRRAKLYYLRGLKGKSARIKEIKK